MSDNVEEIKKNFKEKVSGSGIMNLWSRFDDAINELAAQYYEQRLAEIEIQSTLFATMANNQIDRLKKENKEYKHALGHTEAALAKWGNNDDMADLKFKLAEKQSRIDRAVEYLKQGQSIHAFTILTEGDCKIVETKPQTKAKRSSK
jgi:hypothetical protein